MHVYASLLVEGLKAQKFFQIEFPQVWRLLPSLHRISVRLTNLRLPKRIQPIRQASRSIIRSNESTTRGFDLFGESANRY